LIDNIIIRNCTIASDYEECILLAGFSGNAGNIGKIYVENCSLTKNHNRSGHVIKSEIGYKELNISNSTLVYNSTGSGAFYDETDSATSGKLVFNNVTLNDKSSASRGLIITRQSLEDLIVDNVSIISTNTVQALVIRADVHNAYINNFNCDTAQYLVRVYSTASVSNLRIDNCYTRNSECLLQIGGQVTNLALNNIITNNTTYVISVGADQTGLIITANNINSSSFRTLDVGGHTTNIRLRGYIVTNFNPSSASAGDFFIYSSSTSSTATLVPKVYSNSDWRSITL
jgi:hypothetical protein